MHEHGSWRRGGAAQDAVAGATRGPRYTCARASAPPVEQQAALGGAEAGGARPLALQIAEVDKSLIDGGDEFLQMTNLLAFTMRQLAPS